MMRFLKVLALFVSALAGLVLGEMFGVMPAVFGWDVNLDHWVIRIVHERHYFTVGVFVSVLTLACSRLLRFPDVAALVVVISASFFYTMVNIEYLALGSMPLADWLWSFYRFQGPYFVGVFSVMGAVHVAEQLILPVIRRRTVSKANPS